MRRASVLIIVEAILCFGLPLYFLAWGLVSMVLMLPMALAGEWFAIFNVLITLSGSLGAFALFHVVRFLVTGKSESFARSWLPYIFAVAALLGLWAIATNQARVFEFDIVLVLLVYVPTLASLHLLWLVRRRLRMSSRKPSGALVQ
jgi:hypothetical protein